MERRHGGASGTTPAHVHSFWASVGNTNSCRGVSAMVAFLFAFWLVVALCEGGKRPSAAPPFGEQLDSIFVADSSDDDLLFLEGDFGALSHIKVGGSSGAVGSNNQSSASLIVDVGDVEAEQINLARILSRQDQLDALLAHESLQAAGVPGDGNCLFHAFSIFDPRHPLPSSSARPWMSWKTLGSCTHPLAWK